MRNAFMDWAWRQSPPFEEKQAFLDAENQPSRRLILRPRDVGPFAQDLSDEESTPQLPATPFAGRSDSVMEDAAAADTNLMSDGSGIQEVVEACPEQVITFLKDHAVIKLGTFHASDSEVLKAFGRNSMLTRGCQVLHDSQYEQRWRDYLAQRARQRSVSIGWEERVRLGAYAVTIKDVAGRDRGALLQLLIKKYTSGATSKKIWEFPAVRAVIAFHWQHWAWKFLLFSALIFVSWLLCFTVYLVLFIESGFEDFELGEEMSPVSGISSILNFLCFVLMLPFAVVEVWTMIKQRQRWLQPWNLIDLSTVALQTFIFGCHMTGWPIDEKWIGAVLACQCVLLHTRLQYYGRVMGTSASILEICLTVMYEVRYLLAYILLTGLSASLCLGALYKKDEGFAATDNKRKFEGVRNSLATTFHIMFGAFDTDFIFDADHPWIKMMFFFGLQFLMTITVLNLVIAVMTEAYSKFAADQRLRYNRSRALAIDELEVLGIPNLFTSVLKPYIHFLVVEKRPRKHPSCPADAAGNVEPDDLRKRVDSLATRVETLINLIAARNGDIGFDISTSEE